MSDYYALRAAFLAADQAAAVARSCRKTQEDLSRYRGGWPRDDEAVGRCHDLVAGADDELGAARVAVQDAEFQLLVAAWDKFFAVLPSSVGRVIPLVQRDDAEPGVYLPLEGPIVGRITGGHIVYLVDPVAEEEPDGSQRYCDWAVAPLPGVVVD